MADNVSPTGMGVTVATDKVTFSGDVCDVQLFRPVHVAGSEGSKTVVDLTDATGTNAHLQPTTAGGCSTYHVVSASSTNAANVKNTAGQVYGVTIFNLAVYPVYVKLHNTG